MRAVYSDVALLDFRSFNPAMWGLIRDILLLLAVVAALVALGWFTQPIDQPPLRTVKTCAEITALAMQKDHRLTPAEKTDLANCTTP
jgi:hypothetical protein